MQIRIATTVNDTIYESDALTIAQMVEQSGRTENEVKEQMTKVTELVSDIKNATRITIPINGVERNFNPDHILWLEVDLQGEDLTYESPVRQRPSRY